MYTVRNAHIVEFLSYGNSSCDGDLRKDGQTPTQVNLLRGVLLVAPLPKFLLRVTIVVLSYAAKDRTLNPLNRARCVTKNVIATNHHDVQLPFYSVLFSFRRINFFVHCALAYYKS